MVEWGEAIGEVLSPSDCVEWLMPVDTNIIIFKLKEQFSAEKFAEQLKEQNILCIFSVSQACMYFLSKRRRRQGRLPHTLNTLFWACKKLVIQEPKDLQSSFTSVTGFAMTGRS